MSLVQVGRGAALEARDVTTDIKKDITTEARLKKAEHPPTSMPARTGSRDSPSKPWVEPYAQPGVAIYPTKQDVASRSLYVTNADARGLQVPSGAARINSQHDDPGAKTGSFVEEFRAMFLVSSFFGIHVIRRLGDGCYVLSLPRLCVAIIVLCIMAVCLGMTGVASYFIETTHDLRLFAICLLFSGLTSSSTFFVWLTKSSKIMAFLAEVDAATARVKKPKLLPLVIVALSLLPLAYTFSILFMTPLTDYFLHVYAIRLLFLSPLFLSSMLPCLMDVYIMSSVHVVVTEVRGLEGRVRGAELWTPRFTNEVADHWLRVTKLLGTCNEVSNQE